MFKNLRNIDSKDKLLSEDAKELDQLIRCYYQIPYLEFIKEFKEQYNDVLKRKQNQLYEYRDEMPNLHQELSKFGGILTSENCYEITKLLVEDYSTLI